MEIKRAQYLDAFINRMHNGMIKVVTAIAIGIGIGAVVGGGGTAAGIAIEKNWDSVKSGLSDAWDFVTSW